MLTSIFRRRILKVNVRYLYGINMPIVSGLQQPVFKIFERLLLFFIYVKKLFGNVYKEWPNLDTQGVSLQYAGQPQ